MVHLERGVVSMSWSHCGKDSEGRQIGYAIAAICDHPGCTTKIDRGLSFACGGMHGETEVGCEKYFCATHLQTTVENGDEFVTVCNECRKELEADECWRYDEQEDMFTSAT